VEQSGQDSRNECQNLKMKGRESKTNPENLLFEEPFRERSSVINKLHLVSGVGTRSPNVMSCPSSGI